MVAQLVSTGRGVRNCSQIYLGAGLDLAARGFQFGRDACDYMLFLDRRACGAVAA